MKHFLFFFCRIWSKSSVQEILLIAAPIFNETGLFMFCSVFFFFFFFFFGGGGLRRDYGHIFVKFGEVFVNFVFHVKIL